MFLIHGGVVQVTRDTHDVGTVHSRRGSKGVISARDHVGGERDGLLDLEQHISLRRDSSNEIRSDAHSDRRHSQSAIHAYARTIELLPFISLSTQEADAGV